MDKREAFLTKWRFEIFLLSLLILQFGDLILPVSYKAFWVPLLFVPNILAAYVLIKHHRFRKWLVLLFFIVFLTIGLETVTHFNNWEEGKIISIIVYLLYFSLISIEIFKYILTTQKVGAEMISAVFCGFINLTMIGSFLFLLIETNHPDSFSNLGTEKYININYFSFMTTLTIGFGDIAPLTQIAKKATTFLGVLGNFYSVIITGIVIGKYLKLG